MTKKDFVLEAEFHVVLEGLQKQNPRLLVGCSGGADSLALTLLCADWIALHGGEMLALVVDHGLRADSALEAEQTKNWLEQYGIRAQLVRVSNKPSGNVLAFARHERFGALCVAAEEFSADAILLGHHKGDQAETVLDHLARGSHAVGLCGMQVCSHYQGKLLLRPLLQQSASRLRAYAQAHHAPIIDDPSNRNTDFRRVQFRNWLWQSPRLIDHALEIAKNACHLAGVELAASRQLLHETLRQPLYGVVQLQAAGWQAQPESVQHRTLGSVVRFLSARDFPPRRKQVRYACDWLHHGSASQITLNGVRLHKHQQDVWLYGETRTKPQVLAPQQTCRWGAHWMIRNLDTENLSVRVMERKLWRKLMPEFADQAFLGETCPVLYRQEDPQSPIMPYSGSSKYFEQTLQNQFGADLFKSGLYFDRSYPIS